MLHSSTFEYLKPTDRQIENMSVVRTAVADLAEVLQQAITEGPDKTYLLRKLREVGMWANVAITREADGSPRLENDPDPDGARLQEQAE